MTTILEKTWKGQEEEMFPIFLWVEEYKGFKNFQINLDTEYECKIEIGTGPVTLSEEEIKNEKPDIFALKEVRHIKKSSIIVRNLTIKKTDNSKKIKRFYGENIKNLKIIVGKNGTGKSSILEFLTLENRRDYNYLLICKPNKDISEEELFYVEGNLPAIFSKEALEFIENKDDVEELTNIFSFYMDINRKFHYLGQQDNRTRKSLMGRVKYGEKLKAYRANSREDAEIERFYSSYSTSYEYIYVFLNDIYWTKLYENYRNVKIEITFKENPEITVTKDYGEEEQKIVKEAFHSLDITEIFAEKTKQDRILKAFCNDAYRHKIKYEMDRTYGNNIPSRDEIITLAKEIKAKYLKGTLKETLKELLNDTLEYAPVDYYDQYINFYSIIEENEFFKSDSQIFEINGTVEEESRQFLKIMDSYYGPAGIANEIYKFFEVKSVNNFLSDGENAFISLFSTINYFITTFGDKSEGKYILLGKEYVTLMFDEPDLYLHPEWCRIFLSKLLEVLETYKEIDLYKDILFNLIIVTHSPYLLSDAMNTDIIYFGKEQEGNPKVERKVNKTFGANIMDLYKESFFMESTFGEFAKNKIQEIVEELSGRKDRISSERKEEIWETIQMIGENLVRKKLKNMYEEYFDIKEDKSELEKLIEEKGLSKDDISKLIKQIKGV